MRKPIYADSVGGWRKHKDRFAPLVDSLADLIEAYEGEAATVQPM